MKHSLAMSTAILAVLTALLVSPVGLALVPGPILFSDQQLQSLQQDSRRQLTVPPTRARASCLTLAGKRFCPGIPLTQAQLLYQQLPPEIQKRVLLFAEDQQFKAVLAFLPALIKLPPLRLGEAGLTLGPESVDVKSLTAGWPILPVQQAFDKTFAFKAALLKGLKSEDLHVWYYGELHLGLLTQLTAQGEFVMGAFVVK